MVAGANADGIIEHVDKIKAACVGPYNTITIIITTTTICHLSSQHPPSVTIIITTTTICHLSSQHPPSVTIITTPPSVTYYHNTHHLSLIIITTSTTYDSYIVILGVRALALSSKVSDLWITYSSKSKFAYILIHEIVVSMDKG